MKLVKTSPNGVFVELSTQDVATLAEVIEHGISSMDVDDKQLARMEQLQEAFEAIA